ncbi:MAG TPA: hypothetical protein VGN20_18270 [Mucilaginibacter sp.]|jgi:hypothetical protein
MNKIILIYLAAALTLLSLPALSQDKKSTDKKPQETKPQDKKDTTAALGLAGDNLDLYAVLDLFQKSKTIEAFEKSLNDEKLKINNLDLNLDKKVDFIKVVTTKKDSSYTFILRDDVSKTESQDVAIILLDKAKGKVSLQIVGDEELYGKDYVVEPKGNSSITANPGYTGEKPVTVNVPATTTVVVQSAPIVQYVYSPAYVPYYPPYYYGYSPPWFAFATVMAVGIYRHNHFYGGYHGGYHGGHYGGGNTVVINNRNSVNHYNNTRNTSNTVRNNQNKGNYGNGTVDRGGNRGSSSTRPSTSDRAGNGASGSNRPSTSDRAGNGASGSNRPSTSDRSSGSNRQSSSPSVSNRQSSPSRSSGSSYGGGGRSMGGGRSGGGGGGRRR